MRFYLDHVDPENKPTTKIKFSMHKQIKRQYMEWRLVKLEKNVD